MDMVGEGRWRMDKVGEGVGEAILEVGGEGKGGWVAGRNVRWRSDVQNCARLVTILSKPEMPL